MFTYDTIDPRRILDAVKKFVIGLGERGEVAIPFIESVDEDSREAVTSFVNNSGATSEDVKGYKSLNEFMTGYKPKAAAAPSAYNIPNDIAKDPIFEKYKTQEERDRALVAAQKFLGREKLPVPIDENDAEGYKMIFTKLGLPANGDGYKLPTDLQLPDGLPISDEMLVDFRKVAHEHGILPKQFAGLYKWYMETTAKQYETQNAQKVTDMQTAENDLHKKWGAGYEGKKNLAMKVFKSFADEKTTAEFEKELGNNPIVIELFANIGDILSEDQLVGKPTGLTATPEEAQMQLNKIRGDKNHPYWDAVHPEHKDAMALVDRLTRLTLPSG